MSWVIARDERGREPSGTCRRDLSSYKQVIISSQRLLDAHILELRETAPNSIARRNDEVKMASPLPHHLRIAGSLLWIYCNREIGRSHSVSPPTNL